MGPWHFFASYFRLDNPFLWAHAVIGLLSAVLIVKLNATVRETEAKLDRAGDLSETEVRSFAFPSTAFLGYLESCGAGFVLVGLVGTMYEFVGALPKLQQTQYDFIDFAEALSTSAFGIVWSVLLTLLVSSVKASQIDPITKRLYEEVKAQKLAEILAHTVHQFGEAVTRDLRDGTIRFASATTELANAAGNLGKVTHATAESFGAGMERTIKSAERLNELVVQLSELPSRIATQLETTFETIAKTANQQSLRFQEEQEKRTRTAALGFGKALADALSKLDGLPNQMEGAVAAQSRVYGEAFNSLSRGAIEQLTSHLENLRRKEHQTIEREMLEYQKAVDKMIRTATSGLQTGITELVTTTTTLSRAIAQAVRSSNERLTETLSRASALPERPRPSHGAEYARVELPRLPDISGVAVESGEADARATTSRVESSVNPSTGVRTRLGTMSEPSTPLPVSSGDSYFTELDKLDRDEREASMEPVYTYPEATLGANFRSKQHEFAPGLQDRSSVSFRNVRRSLKRGLERLGSVWGRRPSNSDQS